MARPQSTASASVVEPARAGVGRPVVVLGGDYDAESVPMIERLLRRRFGPFFFRRHLIVDLSAVRRIDGSFIDLVVGLAGRLHGERRELVLVGPAGDVRREIAFVGLHNLVPVYDSVDEALAALEGPALPLIPPSIDTRRRGVL